MLKILSKIIVLFSLFLIINCTNKQQNQIIKTIDSIIDNNTKVHNSLRQINIDSIKIIHDSVININKAISKINFNKNINADVFDLLCVYINIEKDFQYFLNYKYANLFELLKRRRLQLEKLKKDAIGRLQTIEKIEEYIKLEDSLMNNLSDDIQQNITNIKQHKNNYYRYNNEIKKLIIKFGKY